MSGTLDDPVDLRGATLEQVEDWFVKAKRGEWAVYFVGRHTGRATVVQQMNMDFLRSMAMVGSLYPRYTRARLHLLQKKLEPRKFAFLAMRGELR